MEASKAKGYKIELLFSNTDGFMVDIDERFKNELIDIINDLSKSVGILLEYELCDAMFQRDVSYLRRNPVNCWKPKCLSIRQSAAKLIIILMI